MKIDLLQITIHTNIPGKSAITFTKDVLYHPEHTLNLTSKYPYITGSVEYPTDKLTLMSYEHLVETFFNRNKFINLISTSSNKSSPLVTNQEIFNKNILTMLEFLFPTKFFVANNLHKSFDMVTHKPSSNSILYNPFNRRYSYLKIDNKPYTITKVVWLNDILNHPEYRKLIEEVHKVIPDIVDIKNVPFSKTSELKGKLKTFLYNTHPYFISPRRETSNNTLQKYINGSDPEDRTQLFTVLDNIYKKYILNAQTTISSDVLETGIDSINIDKSGAIPTKEIFILLDLIDGQVTDENKKEIYCSYSSEYLGNMLEKLLEPTFVKESEFTNLLETKAPIYSINTKSMKSNTTSTNKSNEIVVNNGYNKENIRPKIVQPIEDKFNILIVQQTDKELNEILDKLSKLSQSVSHTNILQTIKNKYEQSNTSNSKFKLPNLHELILEWNNGMNYNNNLIIKLKQMKGSLTSDIPIITEIIQNETEEYGTIMDTKEKEKLLIHILIIQLYTYVINQLINNEQSKPGGPSYNMRANVGGKKHKKRSTLKTKTAGHRKSYNKKH